MMIAESIGCEGVLAMNFAKIAVTLGLLVGLAMPAWTADVKQGTDQVVEGAKKIGQGVEETAKGVGKTVTEGAKEAGNRLSKAGEEAKPVGDKLHDSAKGFGEALWNGMKYAGRTVVNFFTGGKE
jgi:hypothetical protein